MLERQRVPDHGHSGLKSELQCHAYEWNPDHYEGAPDGEADDKSKVYNGSSFTNFTVTITGFVCGDTVAVVSGSATYTGSAVGATLPGTYTIIPQQGSPSATNYDFTTFNDGTLTITYGTCSSPNPDGVILPPINADGTSVFKQGSTVPVKFTVCDANGNPISDQNVVFASGYGSITLVSAVRGTVDNVTFTFGTK